MAPMGGQTHHHTKTLYRHHPQTHSMLGTVPGIQPSRSQLNWASSKFPSPGQARHTDLLRIGVMWPQWGWLP